MPPGQQFEEDDAEDIDVGGGGHRIASKLFGRRVAGSEDAQFARRRVTVGVVGIDQLCDPEIEELDLARGVRDEDVGRLQVAVDDERLVGVLRRFGHAPKQGHPIGDREPAFVAVLRDGTPVHVLHDEIRGSFGCEPRIEEAGDVRVRDAREDVALRLKTGRAGR